MILICSKSSVLKGERAKCDGNVCLYNASEIFPRAEVAEYFVYYGLDDKTNILPDHFLCVICNEIVENKKANGTNPLNRHSKTGCPGTFVHLSTLDFTVLLAKVFKTFGMQISTELLQGKLMDVGHVTSNNV